MARSGEELTNDGAVARQPPAASQHVRRNVEPGAPGPAGGRCVVAMDFGGTKIAVAVRAVPGPDGEAAGSEEAIDVVETAPELGAEANLTRGVALAMDLLAGAQVVAVGACTFGIPHEDGMALSPAIEGWDRLPLRRRLAEAFAAPVVVDTDVKAAAAAEVRHGALAGADPALYLNLGTGLAVALVAGGAVVRGAHGAAGEIGSSLLRASGSGASGVLEDVVSGMGLARAVAMHSDGRRGSQHGRPARTGADAGLVATLFESAGRADADPVFEQLLGTFLDELCFHMVNLTVALDPERIAVGGGLVRSWHRIEGPLRRALNEHVPYPPALVTGAYPFDAALRGAIDLGLELAGVPGPAAGRAGRSGTEADSGGRSGSPSVPEGHIRRHAAELEDLVHTTEGGHQC